MSRSDQVVTRRGAEQRRIRPLYLSCDRDSVVVCWVGIIGNAALIGWLAAWLARHSSELAPPIWHLSIVLILALFVADWFSGLVHWSMDTWFDENPLERLISIAREHHLYPQHILGYGFRDYVAFSSWPNVALVGPAALVCLLALPPSIAAFDAVLTCFIVSAIMFFGTHAHRLGHRQSANRAVCWLQRCGLLMRPGHHSRHHGGNHDTHYCVVNGWANIICDRVGFWRAAECTIQVLTGAVPRRNDHEWRRRFRTDPTFPPGRLGVEAAKRAERAVLTP